MLDIMRKGIVKSIFGLSVYYSTSSIVYAQVLETSFTSPPMYQASAPSIIYMDEQGGILLEGSHEFVDDQPIQGLIKIDADGNLDPNFNHGVIAKSRDGKIEYLSDGKIVVATNDYPSTLYLLSPNGFNMKILYQSNFVDFEVLPDDRLLMIDVDAETVFVIDTLGVTKDDYAFHTDGTIHDFTVNEDYIYLLGHFTELNGHETNNIARLTLDGIIDTDYKSEADFYFSSRYDNTFIEYQNTLYRIYGRNLQKILPSGKLDTSVVENVLASSFQSLLALLHVDSDGIMVRDRNAIKRMNFDGTVDSSFAFQYSKSQDMHVIRLHSGEYLVTGRFGTPNSLSVRKVSSTGELRAFDLKLYKDNPLLYKIKSLHNSIYVGGHFTTVNDLVSPANSLVKLSTNGEYDDSFVVPGELPNYYYVDNIIEDSQERIVTLGSQKLNIFHKNGQIDPIPLSDELTVVNRVIPHHKGLICITNTVVLLDWENKIDANFEIPFAEDIDDMYLLPDSSLLAMSTSVSTGTSSEQSKIIRIKPDLSVDDSYPNVLSDKYRDFYQVNDSVFFAVGDDLVKFSSDGLVDTEFNNNYDGPTVAGFRLRDIAQIHDMYLFLSWDTRRIHVTNDKGQYLPQLSTEISKAVNYKGIHVMEIDKDMMYLVIGEVQNQSLAKVYVNSVPKIIGSGYPASIPEDTVLSIDISNLIVQDWNHTVDELSLEVLNGDHYEVNNDLVLLEDDYSGPLSIRMTVEDPSGASDTITFSIDVEPINDAPVVIEYNGNDVFEANQTSVLDLSNFIIEDIDSDQASLELIIQPGANYMEDGYSITPSQDFSGELVINFVVSDGEDMSEPQAITAIINAPPLIRNLDFPDALPEDTLIVIADSFFEIEDANDGVEELNFKIESGEHFTFSEDSLMLEENYFGEIELLFVAEDPHGYRDSLSRTVQINPVNDPPSFIQYNASTSLSSNNTIHFDINDFTIEDPDDSSGDISISILEDDNYIVIGSSVALSSDFSNDQVYVYLVLFDGEDYGDTVELELTVQQVLNVEDHFFDFKIWPNPADQRLLYRFQNSLNGEYRVRVVSMDGRVMVDTTSFKNSIKVSGELDIEPIHPGLYLFEISIGEYREYQRLLIGF